MRWTRKREAAGLALGALAVASLTALTPTAATAAGEGCSVSYTRSQWAGGFVADVKLTNLGPAVGSWTLTWTFANGQTVTSAWNAAITTAGSAVTASNVSYNGGLATGATVGFGFQGTWTSANDAPVDFALNGVACTGATTGTTTTTSPSTTSSRPTTSTTTTTTSRPVTTTTTTTTTSRATTTTTSRPATTTTTTTTRPTTTTTTTTRPTTTTTTSTGGNAAGLQGFATMSGYGRTGTNGGANGETVTVSSYAALAAAVADDAPRVVRVTGTIGSGGADMLDVGSNKTIIGVGSNATISGFGFDVNGWGPAEIAVGGDICDPAEINSFTHVQNVIIQNLNFTNAADDSINVQCYSHHVWVNYNTFNAGYDGSVDVKRGSDLVTVSNNRFVKTDKTMLLGHSDNNGAQDIGYLRVSYYGNYFDQTNTRTPRVRFGYAHVFNNYYNVTDYVLGLGTQAHIFAEGNHVAAAKTITQTFDTSASLTWKSTNVYNTATITRANSSGNTMADWLDADGSVGAPPYSYTLKSASSSPPVAGAGSPGASG